MIKRGVEREQDTNSGLSPHRIEALADAIFAFSMTLLVISINFPEPEKIADISGFLLSQYNNFWNFALSFLLIVFFWFYFNQQFNHIKRTDSVNVVINILILLFVVLIPFSTSLMSDYPSRIVSEVIFNGNMLIILLLFTLNWNYSCYKKHININENKRHIKSVTYKSLFSLLVAFFAFVLSFIIPGYSTMVYLLLPLIFLVYYIKRKIQNL